MPDRLTRLNSLRLDGFDYTTEGTGYFVTVCTEDERRVFENDVYAETVFETVCSYQGYEGWYFKAFCLMPDHFHLLGWDLEGYGLPDLMRNIKTLTTRKLKNQGFDKQLWQRSYYDRLVRRRDDPKEIVKYVVRNPLRSDLVEDLEDWPWWEVFARRKR